MKRSIASILLLILLPVVSLRAADDKTPATKPSDDDIRALLANLGGERPARRDKARSDLMTIPGESLDDLHRLVTTGPAPTPAVVAGLHDVVVHLYLKREGYTPVIQANKEQLPAWVLGIPSPAMSTGDDEVARLGFPITTLVPGFPNYQALRVGDLVTGIYIRPELSLTRVPNTMTPSWASFSSGIRAAAVGGPKGKTPVVEMQLIRAGVSMRVKVPLTLKPVDLDDNGTTWPAFLSARSERGERYWHAEFAGPLKLVDAN